ncbi:cell division protein FtsQ/DivIB [Endozoicomonas sp. 8E]|uniref:cell division protein FtsQ/DivIB n=1 Tax=Endozoicomonas sp. 8E TaxID=3035692 RepID=UPI002938D5BB|nr:cell division protein FtsQ/DivIB [Endozoicomonas sp. 8E]WOG26171.1 cell division protein FtsQ/DivIB [Endozoicomonas sp. 8E]
MLKLNQKSPDDSGRRSRGASRGKEKKLARPISWRRWLGLTVISALAVALLWIWPVLMMWVNQPIARVEVRSTFNYLEPGDVEKQLAPWLVNRFFYLDLEEMRRAVLDMPWVRKASLRREWPDTLIVRLEERKPIARWQDDGLIDEDGEVFRPGSLEAFNKLPKLAGMEDRSEDVMQQYLAFSQVIRPLGVAVRELRLSTTDSWWLKVDHVDVNLGRDRRMERLQRFIRLYHARLDDRWQDVKRVDLRYLNGASVAWK